MGRRKSLSPSHRPQRSFFFIPLSNLPTTQRGLCEGGRLSPASNVTNSRENISQICQRVMQKLKKISKGWRGGGGGNQTVNFPLCSRNFISRVSQEFMLRAPIGFARWPSQMSALEKRKVFEQSQPGLAIISVRCLKYKSFKCSIFYIFQRHCMQQVCNVQDFQQTHAKTELLMHA